MYGELLTMCSCTQSADYWSSTTDQAFSVAAWLVVFSDGSLAATNKGFQLYARAVRNGS